MSFALLINPNGQNFDGTTFVAPDQFSYTRRSQNYFEAQNDSNGPCGVIEPVAMLQQLEDELGAIFDRAAVEAGSPIKITDAILERAVATDGEVQASFQIGTHSPPLINQPNGVRLFETPTPHPTLTVGPPPFFQFGGSGQLSEDPNVAPGGCVTLPTGMRLFIASDADVNRDMQVLLWLVPFKSPSVFAKLCCCASQPPELPPGPPVGPEPPE